MGHRLSKIYTRTGDAGTTGLGDGTRIAKTHQRVEAMGTVDELNSCIGIICAYPIDTDIKAELTLIQHDLFDLGGELCIPGSLMIKPEQTTHLEQVLDRYNDDLPYLKEFILPAGNLPAAQCHLARCVCRRAERELYRLHEQEPLNISLLSYLNRLSDLLFVIARVLARAEGGAEVFWKREV